MKKNVAGQNIGAQLVSATDGNAFTGSVTVAVTGDAGTQATGSVGSGACTHKGNGYHTYAPAQAETNYDLVAFTFTGTGAIPVTVQVFTDFPQTGDNFARIGAPAGASVSADIAAVKAQTAAIETDTQDLQTQVGTDGAGLTNIPWNAAWDAEVQSEVTDALNAYDPPTKAELDSGFAALNNLSAAQVNAEVDTALADIHLDHLFATTYDPATKPGAADALLNELVESDGGVARFTANALEQAPSGSGGDATAANQTTIINHLTDIKGGTFSGATDSLEAIRDRGDSAWITATGFSTLDAAGVRAAVGLASANLDTQLGTIDSNVDLVLEDTGTSGVVVAGTLNVNVSQISGDTTAADNLEAALDGTGGVTITAALTGNVTGNLSGSVGSVTGNVGGNVTGSIGSLATQAKADVNAEMDTALSDIGLDHLLSTSVTGTDVANNSIFARLVSSSATADWDDYVNTTDSLQALRDHVGDGTNLTEAGGTGNHLTAVPWNSAWDAEVQSECTDALNAYDPPTKAELDSGFAALNDISAAEVNAQVLDVLNTDTFGEPTGVPGATVSLVAKLGYLYMALRNQIDVTASNKTFYDDGGAAEWKKALSDDGTTYSEAEASAP